MIEHWRPLIHDSILDGYEISTNARIRCKETNVELTSKFRTINGFHYVRLKKKYVTDPGGNQTKFFRVDYLVAVTFCPIPNDLKNTDVVVDHIDGVKTNDMCENLKWIKYVPKYYIHQDKDGRIRIIWKTINGSTTSMSYPKFLMEQKLGRKLLPDEDVHHIDENPLNNDISNLVIIKHGDHQKCHTLYEYHDEYIKCDVCGSVFLWTKDEQMRYYYDIKAGRIRYRTCSNKCRSYAGRMRQLGRPIENNPQVEYREIGNIHK